MEYKKCLVYHDGHLYWKKRTSNRMRKDLRAGHLDQWGYYVLNWQGTVHSVARIIWEIHYGKIPQGMQIDHINRVKTDNRLENLRCVTPSENCHNKPKRSDNKSGYKGVYWNKQNKKWRAKITLGKKMIEVGSFACKHEAAEALDKKRKELQILSP